MPNYQRIAWLLPSMARGFYWHPVFSEFSKRFPNTIFYTGVWPGFLSGYEDSFRIKVVGRTRFLACGIGFTLPSIKIMYHLLRIRPRVIITSGFALWSIISLALKPLLGCRVVIVYAGSSAAADVLNSRIKLFARRAMARWSNAFVTNSRIGKNYLTKVLHAEGSRVFARPFEVPCIDALSVKHWREVPPLPSLQHPVLIVIARLVHAKGLHLLFQACSTLQKRGLEAYSLVVVGDGPQRRSLEELAVELGLKLRIHWTGWVEYAQLGEFLEQADVLVLPTLEDTWGMVVLEGMAVGKAILCSKWAGAAEMVVHGDNGYVFDPYQPESLAEFMKKFCDDPKLAPSMGARSKKLIESHTPSRAAQFLARVVEICLKRSVVGVEQDLASQWWRLEKT
jgi:glycosyltransferase involved in cell wall biosynthesis